MYAQVCHPVKIRKDIMPSRGFSFVENLLITQGSKFSKLIAKASRQLLGRVGKVFTGQPINHGLLPVIIRGGWMPIINDSYIICVLILWAWQTSTFKM